MLLPLCEMEEGGCFMKRNARLLGLNNSELGFPMML